MADDDTRADDGHEPDPTDEHDDDLGPDDEGASGEPDEGSADDWTPPTREAYERLDATLKERNEKIKQLRQRAAAAEAKARGVAKQPPPPKKRQPAPPAERNGHASGPDDYDDDDGRDDEAAERIRLTQVRAGAVGAILAAGFQGDRRAARDMAKLMDLAGIEPDDDGDVDDDDLADAIDTLKERFPRLFEAPEQQRRQPARRPSTADKGAGSKSPETADARMSRRLLRQAGYR